MMWQACGEQLAAQLAAEQIIHSENFMNRWRTAISRARPGVFAAALLACSLWRVGAAAQDAPPKNGIVTSEGVTYRFEFAGNVAQVPLENVSGRLLLPVRVNTGKPGFFLIATGDPRTVVDPKPWLPEDASSATKIDFERTLFSMSGLEMQVAQIAPASLVDLSDQVGQQLRGIFGADVLRQFVVEIAYDRSAVHIYDAKSFQYSGKGITLPLIMRGGLPSIHIKVAPLGQAAFEDDFAIQTESDGGLSISKSYVAAHHLRANKFKGFNRPDASGNKTLLARLKTITIGPYHFDEPIAEFPSSSGAENGSGGSIGNALLSRFRIFLDQPHQQVILETGSNFRGSFDTDMSGVVLVAKGANLKTFEVAAVAPKTPGSEAGLQKGDVIAGIDGSPAADLDLSGVRDMFRQIGHEYHLTVVRGDHTVEMKLRMKRLV